MAEGGSDARSYNLFPSRPVVCFEKKEAEKGARRGNGGGRGRERNKWTHLLPKALLLRPIYQKGGEEEFFLIG